MLKFALAGFFLAALAGGACAAEPRDGKADVVLNGAIAALGSAVESGPVAEVKPGDRVTITGDCIANVKSVDRLRVMLTLAGEDGAEQGFHVLATEQAIAAEGLKVRVPDLPETANRDFNVRVFRLGSDMPAMCNAGTIHVSAPDKHRLG